MATIRGGIEEGTRSSEEGGMSGEGGGAGSGGAVA